MAFSVGAIEGELTLDRRPFQRGLRDARAEAKKFTRTPIKARLELNDKPFRERLAKTRTAARRPITTRLDLNDKVARTRITALRRSAQRKLEVRVDLDDRAARARLAGLRAAGGGGALGLANRAVSGIAGTLSQALGGIPVVGNIVGAALTGMTRAAGAAGEALTGLLSRFTSLGSVIPAFAGQAAQLVLSLAGMAAVAGGVIIALNAILGAVVALGGALIALVASAAAAAGGLALLGVAFLGVLGPGLLLTIGLMTRFAAILKTRQAHEQALKQAVLEQSQAERQRKDALQALGQAHRNLREQAVSAFQAMKQAAEDYAHAVNSVQNAALGRQGSRLGLRRARQDLKDFLAEAGAGQEQISKLFQRFQNVDFNPASARGLFGQVTGKDLTGDKLLELQERLFGVKQAVQGVRNADLSYHDSLSQLNKAEAKRADFARRGIQAYGPYRNALEQVSKAHLRLVRATRATNRAQADYERQLKKLTPAEQGALSRVDRLVAGFTRLGKRFSDPVFRAINEVFDKLSGRGSVFEGVLTKLGEATGDFVRSFGGFLGERSSVAAFQEMGDGAAYLTRQLGSRVFINFLRIMRNLARAALPSLRRVAREVGDVFAGWAKKTSNVADFRHRVVVPLIKNFRTWAGLAKDVARLVLSLFKVAAPEGRRLAESMRLIVQRWRRWIDANPEKVRAFFRHAVEKTKEIARALRRVFIWLRDNLPSAAAVAKHAFQGVYNIVKKIVDGVRWLQNASTDVANKFGLGASPKDVQKVITNDFAIVSRGLADLKKHLSPERRTAIRGQVVEALRELLSRRGSVGRQIEISGGQRRRLQGVLDNLENARPPRTRAGGSRRPTRDRTASTASVEPPVEHHFHAHGIENPDQFIAKSARKLATHPHFRRAHGHRLRLAGG